MVILVVAIAGGIPVATRAEWPCLAKVVAGFFFPVAIFLIVSFGGELFTGNTMSMLIVSSSLATYPVEYLF